MITSASIQAVKDRMDIVDVVSHFITLDRNNKALCPFHNEKGASFSVSAKRQTFHCFGCHECGDAIAFVMKKENKDFIQAIEWLAERYHIALEHEKEEPNQKQKREEDKDMRALMVKALQLGHSLYQQSLSAAGKNEQGGAWQYILERREITEEIAQAWGFGWAPKEWKFLTTPLINAGLYEPALQLGLVKTNEGNTYDFYRNRITLPIHNVNGVIIGLAGRWLPTGDKDQDDKNPKYLNPPESLLYNKSKTWYGLYQAITAKAFAKQANGLVPPAFLVEGYLDVISMHEAGFRNTVAACGTAVNIDQVKILKRYTDHFVVLTDGDAAGTRAADKIIDLCLQENVRVDVIELPAGEDPDSYIRRISRAAEKQEPENIQPKEKEGKLLIPKKSKRNKVVDAKEPESDTFSEN